MVGGSRASTRPGASWSGSEKGTTRVVRILGATGSRVHAVHAIVTRWRPCSPDPCTLRIRVAERETNQAEEQSGQQSGSADENGQTPEERTEFQERALQSAREGKKKREE